MSKRRRSELVLESAWASCVHARFSGSPQSCGRWRRCSNFLLRFYARSHPPCVVNSHDERRSSTPESSLLTTRHKRPITQSGEENCRRRRTMVFNVMLCISAATFRSPSSKLAGHLCTALRKSLHKTRYFLFFHLHRL